MSNRKTPILFLSVCLLLAGYSSAHGQTVEEPTLREKKTDQGFLINLKDLIRKSQDKMEDVNDHIMDQAKEARNQERELKAREYYDKAQRLLAEGKRDEATEYFEKAVEITRHPEMEDYIDKSVKRQKAQEKALEQAEDRRLKRLEKERGYSAKEVNKKYRKAEKLFRKEKFIAARAMFEEVNRMFPDHKATQSYLALIDIEIEKEQKGLISSKLDDGFDRNPRKEQWRNELERKEVERRERLEAQAEALYARAVSLYKDDQFELAQQKFKEVEWILPDYKRTLSYLKKVDKEIERVGVQFTEEEKAAYFKELVKREKEEEIEEVQRRDRTEYFKARDDEQRLKDEAEFVYDTAVTLYKKKYYNQAYDKFIETQHIYPDYKKTTNYLTKIRTRMPETVHSMRNTHEPEIEEKEGFLASLTKLFEKKEEPSLEAEMNKIKQDMYVSQSSSENLRKYGTQAEIKYQQALAFYQTKNFIEAQRKFVAVEALFPGYKDTRDYLAKLDQNVFQVKEPKQAETENALSDKKRVSIAQKKSQPGKKVKKIDKIPFKKAETVSDSNDSGQSETVKEVYKKGKAFYKSRNYKLARDAFQRADEMKKGYRSTEKYLERIEDQLAFERAERAKFQKEEVVKQDVLKVQRREFQRSEEKEKQERIEAYKAEKQAALKKEKKEKKSLKDRLFKRADKKEEKIQAPKPREKLAAVSLKDLSGKKPSEMSREELEAFYIREHELKKLKKKEMNNDPTDLKQVVATLYKEGKDLYKTDNLTAAKAKLATVEQLKPGYRKAAKLIAKIDKKLLSGNEALYKKTFKKKKDLTRMHYELEGQQFAEVEHNMKEMYKTLSTQEYQEQLLQQQAQAAEDRRLARQERLRRKKEEELLRLEEQEAFIEGKLTKKKELQKIIEAEKRHQMELQRLEKKRFLEKEEKFQKIQKKEQKQIEKDLETVKKETLDFLRDDKPLQARSMMARFEDLLRKGNYSETERIRLREEFTEERVKIQRKMDKNKEQQVKKAILEDDQYWVRQQVEQIGQIYQQAAPLRKTHERTAEIIELEKRIAEEEKKLKKEKKKEAARLRKLEKRNQEYENKLKRLNKEQQALKEQKTIPNAPQDEIAALEDQTQQELKELYLKRQKEIHAKRELIRQEFEDNIKELYKKAVSLKKDERYNQALVMFEEINKLKPDYKRTVKYIDEIETLLSETAKQTRAQEAASKVISQPIPSQAFVPESVGSSANAWPSTPQNIPTHVSDSPVKVSVSYPDQTVPPVVQQPIQQPLQAQMQLPQQAMLSQQEENVKELYKQAVRLYKEDNYELSARIFLEIDRREPDYKRTRKYITKLQTKLRPPASPARVREPDIMVKPPVTKSTNRFQAVMEALDKVESKLW